MNNDSREAAAAQLGPAKPTLDEVDAEFPRWHCWRGVSGLLYAGMQRSSPPIVVRAEDPLDLRVKISHEVSKLRRY
jgi:hypothetical protein